MNTKKPSEKFVHNIRVGLNQRLLDSLDAECVHLGEDRSTVIRMALRRYFNEEKKVESALSPPETA